MGSVRPFELAVPDETLERIRAKVAAYPWDDMPKLDGWMYGANLDYMKELCAYWLDEFDWRAQEAEINRFDHFTAPIDGLDVHFIHEKGSGPEPKPLLISHGWPGSVVEFLHVVEPLAHPERFGGKEEDAFNVVAPSLPGFGFSGKPDRPMGPRGMATLFAKLMTDVLGYNSYIAQGGDWGGAVSSWLGYEHAPACRAIHLNIMTMRHRDGPQGPEEEEWAARLAKDQEIQDGYRTQQATKPQSLSYAMMDSPVGVAAWIIEKFDAWSDTRGGNIESVHTKDHLLTNIMVYLVTEHLCLRELDLCRDAVRKAVGCCRQRDGASRCRRRAPCFPKSSWNGRRAAMSSASTTSPDGQSFPKGGHFAAMEQPDALIDDIRAFARSLP